MADTLPQLYTVPEALKVLRICRETLYKMERDGELRMTRIRRRTFVSASEVLRIIDGHGMHAGEPVGEPVIQKIRKTKLFPVVSE